MFLNTYRNWFHLLIEISWRNVLLIFSAGFIGSWLFFGSIYYLIVQFYDYYNDEIRRYESHQCIANVQSFVSAFLFSLESQHTIGYGVRYMTEMCPPAYFVLCVQLIVGVLAQTLLAGIVIAKILRPKKRKQEMRFSQSAVVAWPMEEEDELVTNVIPYGLSHTGQVADQLSIASLSSVAQPPVAQRRPPLAARQSSAATARTRFSTVQRTNATVDTVSQGAESSDSYVAHKPVLMIRLADVQHRLYLAESHVRLYMAITKINAQGEKELIGIRDMNVGYDNGTDRVLLLWPVLIRHIIDDDSPFYGMTPEKAQTSTEFELIMTIEGIVEATGMTFQARTSFLPNEIKWGQRFVPIVKMNPKTNNFEVDYSMFDATKPSALPPELLGAADDGTPVKKRSEATNPPANLFTTTIDELSTNVTMPSEHRGATVLRHTSSAARRAENHRAKLVSQNDVRKSIDGNATMNRNDNTAIPAIDSEEGEECNRNGDADGDADADPDEEYCRGGDANLDGSDTNDCDGGSKPLLLMHTHPQAHHTGSHHSSHHGGGTYHHHFHQRHRHHSSSGFT